MLLLLHAAVVITYALIVVVTAARMGYFAVQYVPVPCLVGIECAHRSSGNRIQSYGECSARPDNGSQAVSRKATSMT